jgi:hypothetical protein
VFKYGTRFTSRLKANVALCSEIITPDFNYWPCDEGIKAHGLSFFFFFTFCSSAVCWSDSSRFASMPEDFPKATKAQENGKQRLSNSLWNTGTKTRHEFLAVLETFGVREKCHCKSCCRCFLYSHYGFIRSVVVEWLKLRLREVPGLNPDPEIGHPDRFVRGFSQLLQAVTGILP